MIVYVYTNNKLYFSHLFMLIDLFWQLFFSVRKEDGRNKLLNLVKHTKIIERFSDLLFLTKNEQFISFAWREQGTF